MKLIKRLSLILALVMAFSTFVCAANVSDFTDVSSSDWYYPELSYAVEYSLVNGTSPNTFSPKKTMTRAEFVTVVGRALGAGETTGTKFADVENGSWYSSYVYWAVENGIVTGTSDTTFKPGDNITRQDMATIIGRMVKKFGFELAQDQAAVDKFKDEANIAGYAKDSVELLRKAGILKGDTAGNANPKTDMTRAEGMAVLVRTLWDINNDKPTQPDNSGSTEDTSGSESGNPGGEQNESFPGGDENCQLGYCDYENVIEWDNHNPFFEHYITYRCCLCGSYRFRKDGADTYTRKPVAPDPVTNSDGSVAVKVLMGETECKTVIVPSNNSTTWTYDMMHSFLASLGCRTTRFDDGWDGNNGWKRYNGQPNGVWSPNGYGFSLYSSDAMISFQDACIRVVESLNKARIDAYTSKYDMDDVIFEGRTGDGSNGVARIVAINWFYQN